MLSNLFHTLPVRRKEFSRNIKKVCRHGCSLSQLLVVMVTDRSLGVCQNDSGVTRILSGVGECEDNLL